MKKWVKGDRGRALSYAMKSAQVTGRFGLVQDRICCGESYVAVLRLGSVARPMVGFYAT